jgi:hypothetical protein
MGDQNINIYCAIVLVALFPLSVLIVLYYAEPGFPWHTYITLVLGYYAAFGIMLMVPIDIGTVVIDRRSTSTISDPNYNYDRESLTTIYNVFFTMVLILGSVILGFQEYYNTDGFFTIGGKLWSAFKRMLFDTFVPLVAGCIILGILIGQKVVPGNVAALKLAAVIVTNTIYELGLMFLLGYSLVEYPRSLWSMSDIRGYLLSVQMKAASEFKAISEHQLSVSLVVADVLKTKAALVNYADPTLIKAMDILVSECPPEFRSDRLGKPSTNKQGQITIDTLAALRTRLNVEKDLYKMSQEKIEGTKLLAYRLEDIVAAMNNSSASVIHWSLIGKDSTEADYKWEIVYKPILLKIAAVLCGTLSLLSFLGVICSMKGVSNNVSPYFLAVHDDNATTAGITIFILITFGYTVYIATWAIFQIRTSAAAELVPGRTTPEALSFNVRMVARLAAPLAFFYLGWISENGIRTGSWLYNDGPMVNTTMIATVFDSLTNTTYQYNTTVLVSDAINMPSGFSNFYQLQNIKPVQEVFGTVFPIILYIVLGLFVFNIFNRLLVLVKLGNYQFGAEIVTEEQLREGKRQLQRHRKGAERKFRRGELRNFITNLTSDDSENPGLFVRLFGGWFGRSSEGQLMSTEAMRMTEEKAQIREPGALSGQIERRGAGFALGVGSGWKEHYAEVRSPGFLHFYKDRRSADATRGTDPSYSSDPNSIIVDLRLINDFHVPPAKSSGKEVFELELVTSDEPVKMRFKTATELQTWRQGLSDWKDFNKDFGNIYLDGLDADTESALLARASQSAVSAPGKSSGASGSFSTGFGSSNKKNITDLSQVVVDQDDDDDDNRGGKGNSNAFSGGLLNFGKKKSLVEDSNQGGGHDEKPFMLEGWLEKKGHGRVHMGGDWQRRYARIDETTHSLVYAKSSDPGDKSAGSIDLRMVQEILPYDKGPNGADYSRFNVDAGEKVYKFKAANEIEGRRWIDGLNAWREHFLLNGV